MADTDSIENTKKKDILYSATTYNQLLHRQIESLIKKTGTELFLRLPLFVFLSLFRFQTFVLAYTSPKKW